MIHSKIAYVLIPLLLLLSSQIVYGQDDSINLADYPLNEQADYDKAEPVILQLSELILKAPLDPELKNRKIIIAYIFSWMEGNTEHQFMIHTWIVELSEKNTDLLGLFMAAVSKVTLEHADEERSDAYIQLQTAKLLADYINNPDNGVKIKGKVKKFIRAEKEGTLETFINVE